MQNESFGHNVSKQCHSNFILQRQDIENPEDFSEYEMLRRMLLHRRYSSCKVRAANLESTLQTQQS